MNIKKYSDHIGDLIAKDDLQEAIDSLRNLLSQTPKLDDLIVQSANFNDIKKQIRAGILDFETARIAKNKIRYAILDLLRDIEEHTECNQEVSKELEKIIDYPVTNSINQSNVFGDNIAGNKISYGR